MQSNRRKKKLMPLTSQRHHPAAEKQTASAERQLMQFAGLASAERQLMQFAGLASAERQLMQFAGSASAERRDSEVRSKTSNLTKVNLTYVVVINHHNAVKYQTRMEHERWKVNLRRCTLLQLV